MKKIIFLLVVFLLFGCSTDKKENKIIPNYEKEFNYKKNAWPNSPENEILLKKQASKIEKRVSELLKTKNLGMNLKMRLFVNERGKISYIKFLDGSKSLLNNQKNKERILSLLDKQSFVKLIQDGKNMKYAFDISIHPKGVFDEDEFSVSAEKMPSIVGGVKSLAEKIIYPEKAKKEGIEGRVYIKVFIDENGKEVKAEVLRGIGHGCDEAALSAVKQLHFIPAEDHGEKIKSQVIVPVMFRLQ